MPYIKDENNRRLELRNGAIAQNAGDLNCQIFSYVKYCEDRPIDKSMIETYVKNFLGDKPNYQKYNDMTGCLVCCGKEIGRRLGFILPMLLDILDSYDEEINDYEEEKIIENGDV